jgi:hypothetical protein
MGERTFGKANKPDFKQGQAKPAKERHSGIHGNPTTPLSQILHLQRTIGNQAVGRLMESGAFQQKTQLEPGVQREAEEGTEEEIQRQAINGEEAAPAQAKVEIGNSGETPASAPEPLRVQLAGQKPVEVQREEEEEKAEEIQAKPILLKETGEEDEEIQRQAEEEKEELVQAKLKIGKPGDLYEKEADRVSDHVMRMPDPGVQQQDEEEEEIQAKPLPVTPLVQRQAEEEEEPVQAREAGGASQVVPASTESRINSLSGGGQALSDSERSFFEPRLGHDLSGVRVHTGSTAAETAKSVNARAFTKGSDIVFGQGEYSPGTETGKRLMGHELTHVIQQGGGARAGGVSVSPVRPKVQRGLLGDIGGAIVGAVESVGGAIKSGVEAVAGGFDWVLGKIAPYLEHIPGYGLVKLVIGKDPVTGKAVDRSPKNFLGAFMGLVPGGAALFKNLNESGAIDDAFTWLEKEIKKLNISFSLIWGLIKDAGSYFVRNPSEVFSPLKALVKFFGPPIARIYNFVKAIGGKIKEFVFQGVLKMIGAPVKTIMGIINKGAAVLGQIISNPIGFVKNLISAIGLGIKQFSANIWKHLKAGITGWLFGTMTDAGIQLPEKFDLKGIFSLILQIMGLTWQNIRPKIVKKLGPKGEQIMKALETTFDFVKTLVTKGPIALWGKIKESLGNLKDMVFGAIMKWVRNTIIVKAIEKLISFFNPVGAIIQAVIAIYNTIMFFVERIKQIMAFAKAVLDSIAKIASGNLKSAADAVENAISKSLPVMISFLARLIGLGGISKKIREVIE